jgi:hypothetical protein
MRDEARFKPIVGKPDDLHRQFHGGPAVDLAFRVVDRWIEWRDRRKSAYPWVHLRPERPHNRDGPEVGFVR